MKSHHLQSVKNSWSMFDCVVPTKTPPAWLSVSKHLLTSDPTYVKHDWEKLPVGTTVGAQKEPGQLWVCVSQQPSSRGGSRGGKNDCNVEILVREVAESLSNTWINMLHCRKTSGTSLWKPRGDATSIKRLKVTQKPLNERGKDIFPSSI